MSDEARDKVSAILFDAGVTFSVLYMGVSTPPQWDRESDAWSCAFTKGDGRAAHEETPFYTGKGLRKGNIPTEPHAADVLHSLIMDSSAEHSSFEDWCADYGYDTGSRKAFATYEACQKAGEMLRRVFTGEEITKLAEALQDY